MPRMVSYYAHGLCGLALALLLPARLARAEGPAVYFVGVQRDCERDLKLDHAVERRLFKKGTPVALVRQPSGAPLPPCFGDRCGQSFKQSCVGAKGRLLGAQVAYGKDVLKFRVWLHDLGTGQTAYLDDYCQSCEMVGTLSTVAARLMAAPHFSAAPEPTPTYCTQPSSPAVAPDSGPLFLTVYGDGKHKPVLLAALKQQLDLLGRKVQPVPVESKAYPLEVLQKIVAGQNNAQVLGAEVQKDGKVQLFLYDQKNSLSANRTVECGECEKDKEALVSRVQPEISSILEYCFSETCGGSHAAAPPAAACEPFPDPMCAADSGTARSGFAPAGRHVDPNTAKLVKGITWGAFAVSAASAAVLFGANAAGVGTYSDLNSTPIQNSLWRPAWTATGFAIGLLGIAIPVTVILDRATQNSSAADPSTKSPSVSQIQCPN